MNLLLICGHAGTGLWRLLGGPASPERVTMDSPGHRWQKPAMTDLRLIARQMFDAAVAAADPMKAVGANLPAPPPPGGRVIVIGAGKASARMAEALEAAWPHHDTHPLSGLVITRYGYGRPCAHIEIGEAAHPVPDAAEAAATLRMLDLV